MKKCDVAVIGGGILGCFAARELRRWSLSVIILEGREDICTGISRANTAVVYPGYDHKPGSIKARMTVRANASFEKMCRELDVPFSRCGSMMVSCGERANAVLQRKALQGEKNGVSGLRLICREEALEKEPLLTPEVKYALFSPTAGTVNPWQLGIAACENAQENGAELLLCAAVQEIRKEDSSYVLETSQGTVRARGIVNCAGLSAVQVQELIFPSQVFLAPTAGDYFVLDKNLPKKPTHILQFEPETEEKGLTVVPTVEGSILLGPSERENTEDFATAENGMKSVISQSKYLLPDLDLSYTIRSFAALRPNPQYTDGRSIKSFIIDHPASGFWSMIGIKTPGMTCARELGVLVADRLAGELGAVRNLAFNPSRKGILRAHDLLWEKRKDLVKTTPEYGEIICFCEDVTREEIIEAVKRGAVTIDGVKRRSGAGMGRCQGARCQRKITAILAQQRKIPEQTVTKDGIGSELLKRSE